MSPVTREDFEYVDNRLIEAEREIIALREATDERVTKLEGALLLGAHATNKRLDSHNRVMESIVRRVRALEGGGGDAMARLIRAEEQQDKAERAAVESYNRRCQLDLELGAMRDKAETAERERDAFREQHETCDRDRDRLRSDAAIARASVERLREALVKYGSHRPICEASRRTITGCCTCGLTAALEDA